MENTFWWFHIFLIFTPTWGDDPIWLNNLYLSNGLKSPPSCCFAMHRIDIFSESFLSGQDGTGGWCSLVHKSKCCEPVIGCVGKLTWGRIVVRPSFVATCHTCGCCAQTAPKHVGNTKVILQSWEFKAHISRTDMVRRAQAGIDLVKDGRKSAPNLFYVNRNRANQLKLRRSDWISGVSRTTSGSPDFLSSTVVVIKAAMTIFCPKHSWPKNEIFWTKRWSRSCCFVKIPKLADEIMVQAFALRIFDKQPYQNHGDFCIRKKYVSPFCYAMIRDFFVSCHDGTPWTHASHWRGHFVAVHHVGGWGL